MYTYVLQDLEIPDAKIAYYISCLQRGKYLLVINSTKSQVKQVQSIFNYLGISDWEVYHKPEAYHFNSSNFDKVSVY